MDNPVQFVDNPKIGRIIEAARLAPSASNSQPWRFIISKSDIYLVAQKDCPFYMSREKHREHAYHLIDSGIALSHMYLSAKHLKIKPNITLMLSDDKVRSKLIIPDNYDLIARMSLS